MNGVLQEQNQLEIEKARLDMHIEELNLRITSQIEEINSKNQTIEQTQNRLVEL